MRQNIVRMTGVTIKNFKNVKYGQLFFENKRKPYRTSVLGLYGQNGSGKTALIDAMELLKYVLQGQPLPEKFAKYINVEADKAELRYEFSISDDNEKYLVSYQFELQEEKKEDETNLVLNDNSKIGYKAVIKNEILSYSYENKNGKIKKTHLIDTDTSKLFVPDTKYECLLGKDKEVKMDLLVAKKIALSMSRSFIFSRELLSAIEKNKPTRDDQEYHRHKRLLDSLVRYGNFELFVINTTNSGIISMDVLPLSFKYDQGANKAVGSILVPLEKPIAIPNESVKVVEHVVENMNVVLTEIVPGLTIRVERLGDIVLKNGEVGTRIQLLSLKNEKAIPLQYESEGIKKIISILQLLIVVFNRSSITVAIDELDAGIFEYLLGELLRIISEKGKGQLLFTSHNLRPLETLDRGFIAFTTTNPENRYIRMSNVKNNNNLRSLYFRDILLNEQCEEVYRLTNNAEIAFAFHKAGVCCES